jgi:N-methylhydantoinase B
MNQGVDLRGNEAGAAAAAFDPISFEVIRHALVAAADEMCVALARSAYSTNIKTRLDLSCALLDRECRVIGESTAQPCHISAMNIAVRQAIAAYGVEQLQPGDQLAVNDPYQGAAHLNDVIVLGPIFVDNELVGFSANLAHHVDIGGGAPGSLGAFREIYQEGLLFPVIKIAERGRLHSETFKMAMANIRSKKETAGDFRAQVAANYLGVRRMTEVYARFGRETMERFIGELIEYTAARSRAEFRKLPRGVYEAEEFLDDDGLTDEPIRLHVRVTFAGEHVSFDFTGSDLQRPSPMNASYTQTHAACVYVLRCLIDRDIPTNDGFYRLVEVIAPPGTVAHAQPSVGVAGGWEVSLRMCDLLFKALAPAMPDRVPAGCKAMVCHVCFGGTDPRSNEYYCFLETIAGGHGGRLGSDGPDAVQTHHQNTQNAPVEEVEVCYPVRTLSYGLIPDSEGAGRYRGGLGVRREYTFIDHEVMFTVLADRRKFPPFGLFGGDPGKTARYSHHMLDGTVRDLPSKCTFPVKPGEVVVYETCGGGGYGDPFERDLEAVRRDVCEEKVSRARALTSYGVVFDEESNVDVEATMRVRRERRARGPS